MKKILSILFCLSLVCGTLSCTDTNINALNTVQNQTKNIEENQEIEKQFKYDELIDYVYIENPTIQKTETENVCIKIKDGYSISNASLNYEIEGQKYNVDEIKNLENVYLFSIVAKKLGEFTLISLNFEYENKNYSIDLTKKEEMSFDVVSELNQDDLITQNFVEDDSNISLVDNYNERSINGKLVICLDPGHDNTHVGAHNESTGIYEEAYTLAIAKACREELQTYDNVEVIMSRGDDGNCPYPGTKSGVCNEHRVKTAKEQGADYYIALHLNSGSTSSYGSEVYISNYSGYHNDASELASSILNELSSLGLSSRGVKIRNTEESKDIYYSDGTIKDYYGVIRNGVVYGVNSMIVEHGFIDNSHDANIIKNQYNDIGKADATAIAKRFGLVKKGVLSFSSNLVETKKTTVNINKDYIKSGYDKSYQLIGCNVSENKDQWKTLSDEFTSTSFDWTPEASGTYIFGIRSFDSNHNYSDEIVWKNETVDAVKVSIDSITLQKKEDKDLEYMIVPSISKNVDNLSYEFLAYDLRHKQWISLQNGEKDTAQWIPKTSGQYLVGVRTTDLKGNQEINTIGWTIEEGKAQINSFSTDVQSPQKVNSKILLSADINTLSDENVEYEFMVHDGNSWSSISKNKELKNIEWNPQKAGTYLLCFQIRTITNTYNSFISYNITKPSIALDGFTWNYLENEIQIGVAYSTNDKATFTWKSYDLDNKKWKTIAENTSSNWISWKPSKGNYWIYVEAKTSDGTTTNKTMNFAVGKDYSTQRISLDGFTWNYLENEIQIGVAYSTNDKATFTWKSYDLDNKKWKTIAENTSSNWISWKPSKGNYWIYVEAKTSDGTTTNKTMNFAVGKDYSTQRISLDGFTWNYLENEIQIGVAYSTNDKATFTWKSYDLDNKKWKTIAENTSSNWISWKPSKGNYWIYVEAKTSDGTTTNKTMNFAVGKDYNVLVTKINGINVSNLKDGKVQLNADITSNDPNLEYIFKAYCTNGEKKWYSIGKNNNGFIEWTPKEEGDHLIVLDVYDSDGKKYTYSMGCSVQGSVDFIDLVSNKNGSQSIETNIQLTGKSKINGIGTYEHKILIYDGKEWKKLGESLDDFSIDWKPTIAGNYLLCYQITSPKGKDYNAFINYNITPLHEIMGNSSTTVSKMVNLYKSHNSSYDEYAESMYNGCLSQGGAPNIETFCQVFLEEANAEGVRAEVAFAQAMLETGFLKYGGDVKPNQYNFAGLGATGGVPGNDFIDVRTGIRAQIQHLKCYASTESLNNERVDKRWSDALRGKAEYVEYLSIPSNPYGTGWAASSIYGQEIIKLLNQL